MRLRGTVRGSLLRSIIAQGERSELVDQFADIFVWQLDFSRQSQSGDEYRLVVEKYYDELGFVRYGKILAAQYTTPEADLTAIYFQGDSQPGGYYTPSGQSLRRTFLRAPLHFTRISSGYSKLRLHPVLNRPMPHEAIDYAAPKGTPVWTVADGIVRRLGWMGGLGRVVVIEHANGCQTYYGHLSKYGENLEVGSAVQQRRILGFVGQSGLATGPHLDFRVKCRGQWINPAKLVSDPDAARSIRMEDLFEFERVKQAGLIDLRDAEPPLILEASM